MIHQANHLHMLGCNPWWKSWKVGKRWYKIHPNTSRVTTYDEVTTKHKAGVCSRSLLTTFQNGPKGALGHASHKSYAPNTASKSYHKGPSATKTLEPISPIGTYWNHSSRPQRSAASPAFFKPPASRTPANNLPCASRHPDIPTCRDLKIHAARDRCDSDISDISDTARVPFFWRSLVPNGCMAGRIKKNNMPGLMVRHRRNQQF